MATNVTVQDADNAPLLEITRNARFKKYLNDNEHLTLPQRTWQYIGQQYNVHVKPLLKAPSKAYLWFLLTQLFPIINTALDYKNDFLAKLSADFLAGVAVTALMIPQVVSYASNVANLPVTAGLYATFIPMAMYLFLGTSHHINVGPVAVVSVLTNEYIGAIYNSTNSASNPQYPLYVEACSYLALIVGIWNLIFGFFNIGFLLRLLSPAYIEGFVAASAFVIGSTQIGSLWGLSSSQVPTSSFMWQEFAYLAANLNQSKWLAFLMGFGSLVFIVVVRKKFPRWPVPFFVVVVMTFVSWLLITYHSSTGYTAANSWPVSCTNTAATNTTNATTTCPEGLPAYKVPSVASNIQGQIWGAAFIITFVGYMESYSLAVTIGEKRGYVIRGNQEFLALGVANVVSSFFQTYPVTGSFSRTAEADLQNARTIFYTVVSIITMIIVVGTPVMQVFFYLPKSILSAIVLAAVVRLANFEPMVKYWYSNTGDFLIWSITFIGVIGGGPENGLAIGAGFMFIIVVFQQMFPYIAYLGTVTGSDGKVKIVNLKRFPQAVSNPNVLILRFDNALVFFNREYFIDKVVEKTTPNVEGDFHFRPGAPKVAPKVFILDGSAIHHVDTFGAEALIQVTRKLRARGITPLFAYLRSNVKDVLLDSGVMDEINYQSIFLTVEDAYKTALKIVDGHAFEAVADNSKAGEIIDNKPVEADNASTASDSNSGNNTGNNNAEAEVPLREL